MEQTEISQLTKITNDFYARLAAGEEKAFVHMATAYSRTIDRLTREIDKVSSELAVNPTVGKLAQQQRLGALINQAGKQWYEYTDDITSPIARAQLSAIRAGAKLAGDSLEEVFSNGPATLSRQWDALPTNAITEVVGNLQDGSPLRTLAANVAKDMKLSMTRELLTGIALGKNPREVARGWNQLFDAQRSRLNTIARTEMLRAAREGSRRAMQTNSDVVKGWKWYSRRDRRSCAVCFAMHGREFQLRVKMATHPNCRCTMLPVTKTWQELGFSQNVPNAINPAFVQPSEGMLLQDSGLCRTVLGKGGCFGFQNRLINLPDFIQDTYHPQWGYGRTVKPLSRIVSPIDARQLSRGVVPPGLKPKPKPAPVAGLPTTVPVEAPEPPRPVPAPSPAPGGPIRVANRPAFATPEQAAQYEIDLRAEFAARQAVTTKPVKDSMRFKDKPTGKYGKDLHEAAEAITKVHTDGDLLPIEVTNSSAKRRLGAYSFTHAGRGIKIDITKGGDHRPLTFWHEVGHWLDHQALTDTPRTFASEKNQSPVWVAWREAIDQSRAVRKLREAKAGPVRYIREDGGTEYVDKTHIRYMLGRDELWARSYAQFIAKRSGNIEQVDIQRAKRQPDSYNQDQWDDDDFAPIEAAIEAILKERGYIG